MRGRCKNAIALLLASAQTGLATERTITVFDFRFIDTSLEGATNGPRADAHARLARPAWGSCDVSLGRELGARFAISGWGQRVSNLIRNMKMLARDPDSGHLIPANGGTCAAGATSSGHGPLMGCYATIF
jgi:hypothetical protein